MSNLQPFHLAIPVADIEAARHFYGTVLKCPEGRSSPEWIDFDFFGHQVVVHLDHDKAAGVAFKNKVDSKDVPIPHFGVVLSMEAWEALAESLKGKGIQFVIEPCIRFKGEVGEQATMFFLDPSGNAIEFKAFKDMKSLFAK
jgi:uncharacterized protein